MTTATATAATMTTTTAPTTQTTPTATKAMLGAPRRFVDVGHGRVALWSFGALTSAPPVLLVHGWPLTGLTWRHVVPLLAQHTRVHVIDLPGVGQSRVERRTDINVNAHARAVRAVIAALRAEDGRDVVVGGHDSGGAIARMAAADNPGVCGVVVGDSELPGHIPWQVKIYVALVRLGLGAVLAAGMQVKVLRQGPIGTGGLFKDVATGEGEFRRLFLDSLRDPVVRAGQLALAETIDSSFTADLAAVHARIHCPTLCIWGSEDPFFPIAGARAMLPMFKGGARLTEIPGAKLFAHEDCADAFVVAVVEFLDTLHRRQAEAA